MAASSQGLSKAKGLCGGFPSPSPCLGTALPSHLIEGVHGQQHYPGHVQGFDNLVGHCGFARRAPSTQAWGEKPARRQESACRAMTAQSQDPRGGPTPSTGTRGGSSAKRPPPRPAAAQAAPKTAERLAGMGSGRGGCCGPGRLPCGETRAGRAPPALPQALQNDGRGQMARRSQPFSAPGLGTGCWEWGTALPSTCAPQQGPAPPGSRSLLQPALTLSRPRAPGRRARGPARPGPAGADR